MSRVNHIATFTVLTALIAMLGFSNSPALAGPSYVISARVAYVRARNANRRAQENKILTQRRLRNGFKTSEEVNTVLGQFRTSTKQRTGERQRVESTLLQNSHDYRLAVSSYSQARSHSNFVSLDRSSHPRDRLEAAQAMVDRDSAVNKMTRLRLNVDDKYIDAHLRVLFYVRKLNALKREFEAALQSQPQQVAANQRLEAARMNLEFAKTQLNMAKRGLQFRFGNRLAPGLPRPR